MKKTRLYGSFLRHFALRSLLTAALASCSFSASMKTLVNTYLFFDSASTTKCCETAVQLLQKYASEEFGNPSSLHAYGQKPARAIREARSFFANFFNVEPDQIIFTGSGSEANNLAIYGIALRAHLERLKAPSSKADPFHPTRVLSSSLEHPSVKKTVDSLEDLGIEGRVVPTDSAGQLDEKKFLELLTPATVLVSVQQVNNILGIEFPVEKLALKAKKQLPSIFFHTDAVQAFGKIHVPRSPSSVDLISISGHKISGPKGVGALVILNKKLLQSGLRPLLWGGSQENGLRSGTQNAGLIAAFHAAAEWTLARLKQNSLHFLKLQSHFKACLTHRGLLSESPQTGVLRWNSPLHAIPYIVSLSVPGLPSRPFARLLEERNCLVSVGSACHARKSELDPILGAMGFSLEIQHSAIRVSFSETLELNDIETLAHAIDESIQQMRLLLGKTGRRNRS